MVSVLSGFCRRVCTRPAAPPISLFSTRKIWSPGRSPVRASVTSRTSTPAPAPVDLAVKPSGWNDWTLRTTLQPLSATAASASSSETTSRRFRAFIGGPISWSLPGEAHSVPPQRIFEPASNPDFSILWTGSIQKNGCDPNFRIQRIGAAPVVSGNAQEAPGFNPGWVRGLELDGDAAHQPAAQLVVVGDRAGGVGDRAAAQLHVELDRPVRREVHQEAEILGELEAQALDVDLGGRTFVVARLQLLGEVM